MISKEMETYVAGSSAIRAMFEEGAKMAAEFGAENVYDFSLGNPSVPAPEEVNAAIRQVLDEETSTAIHGYTPNSGDIEVRRSVAEHLNRLYGTDYTADNILMTVGAAGGLNVILKTILDPGTEVVAFAPYFVEYRNYVANFGGELKVVPPNPPTFLPDTQALRDIITEKTRAVIINSPNNPTGVIYGPETLTAIADVLREKSAEYGRDIFLLADEPYRELAFDGAEVPFVPDFYDNTVIGYSYSKSLSLPGDRIGYLVIPNTVSDFEDTVNAANIANRILGFVNAPSLMQKVVAKCLDAATDVAAYDKNRKALYEGLTAAGYECVRPNGAFYLWIKSPLEDDAEFCALAKKYRILLVPGKSFDGPGYVRAAYCVAYDTIVNSLPQFTALMEEIRGL